jgi:hypothetical protein
VQEFIRPYRTTIKAVALAVTFSEWGPNIRDDGMLIQLPIYCVLLVVLIFIWDGISDFGPRVRIQIKKLSVCPNWEDLSIHPVTRYKNQATLKPSSVVKVHRNTEPSTWNHVPMAAYNFCGQSPIKPEPKLNKAETSYRFKKKRLKLQVYINQFPFIFGLMNRRTRSCSKVSTEYK